MTFAEIQRACCLGWCLLWKKFWIGLCLYHIFPCTSIALFLLLPTLLSLLKVKATLSAFVFFLLKIFFYWLSTPLINCLVFVCLHRLPWSHTDRCFLNLRNESIHSGTGKFSRGFAQCLPFLEISCLTRKNAFAWLTVTLWSTHASRNIYLLQTVAETCSTSPDIVLPIPRVRFFTHGLLR